MSTYRKNTLFVALIFIILYLMEFYGGYLLAGLNFAFPMDDPYIHLAMGKNLALHGSWGPMEGVFNSSSSSLLYTLIISAFFFLGIPDIGNIIMTFTFLQTLELQAELVTIMTIIGKVQI